MLNYTMGTLTLMLLLLAFTSATATRPKSQFTRYRSWNTRMYPVWKDGDSRFRNCWFGGEVTFDIKNDAPTLTGAKVTFNVNLHFPPNQTVRSDGQVVWNRNCTINGTQYQEGQAVYPNQNTDGTGVFPDGSSFARGQNRKPQYVFVWKTWGRFWQVAGGPSSSLSISTDNVPLGSYNMEVVIYHCRGKDKFIPLGYASTIFSITDQIPFTVSLSQVNDVNQDDQDFIQNRAVAFNVKLHDPSQYLSASDITFNWDFGDNTGTLISKEDTVTHTYLTPGTFKPQVVLMASIPNGCLNPTAAIPTDPSVAPAVVVMASTPGAAPAANPSTPPQEGDGTVPDAPASEATLADDLSLAASVAPADVAANTDDGAAVADPATEVPEVASVAPVAADEAVVPATGVPVVVAVTPDAAALPAELDVEDADAAAAVDAAATAAATVAPAAEEGTADDVAAADETTAVTDAAEVNAQVTDAAVSVAPVAEGEGAAADLGATVLPEVPDAVATAPTEEVAVVLETDVAVAPAATEAVQTETAAPTDNVLVPAATESTPVVEAGPTEPAAAEAETETVDVAPTTEEQPVVTEETVPAEGEVEAAVEIETDTDPAQVALVVAKRQAPELAASCMVYRYGSLSTSVDIIQGIESVEIVQMASVVSLATELEQNAVDLTITCQGSLPNEVCTVISDADCITPMETVCSAATPSPDCQMILRQFFNDSGVFCINVSLTNDVSLAVASARVSVTVGTSGTPVGTAAIVLGVMVLACVVGAIALMYRRFKQYQPLREDHDGNGMGSSTLTSVPLLLWNLLSRQSPGESRPLLQGRVV